MKHPPEMNDLIVELLLKLRHDFPHFTEDEREEIRTAIWKAWYIAYPADKRTRVIDTPLTPSV